MKSKLSLKVETQRDELNHIIAAVEDMADRENWPPELVFRVQLAIEEVVLNVMDYGYDADSGEGPHELEVIITSEADSLTIEVVDSGRPFDPLHDASIPDLEASVEERKVGGLGIHLVRTMMDQVNYRREQGRNHLTLVARKAE